MNQQDNKARRTVAQIPPGNQYEGYLWYSDAQKPIVYQPGKAFQDDFVASAIPFVVEGWLYHQVANKSYAIRYLDGKYIRTEYDLSVAEKEMVTYQAHDLQPITQFRVKEYWAPEEDPNCDYMEVLRHTWTAFAGFVHPKK
jgi:CRISPR type III-associated protein (TIGR04423 family)